MDRTADDERLMRAQAAIKDALAAAEAIDWLTSHSVEQIILEVLLTRSGDADSGAPQARTYLAASLQKFKEAIRDEAYALALGDYETGKKLLAAA